VRLHLLQRHAAGVFLVADVAVEARVGRTRVEAAFVQVLTVRLLLATRVRRGRRVAGAVGV